jgi:hypothetical protein
MGRGTSNTAQRSGMLYGRHTRPVDVRPLKAARAELELLIKDFWSKDLKANQRAAAALSEIISTSGLRDTQQIVGRIKRRRKKSWDSGHAGFVSGDFLSHRQNETVVVILAATVQRCLVKINGLVEDCVSQLNANTGLTFNPQYFGEMITTQLLTDRAGLREVVRYGDNVPYLMRALKWRAIDMVCEQLVNDLNREERLLLREAFQVDEHDGPDVIAERVTDYLSLALDYKI